MSFYPGYMPYKNLGIVEDLPGYIDVHRSVLGYDFDTFVGGHVDRLGTLNFAPKHSQRPSGEPGSDL